MKCPNCGSNLEYMYTRYNDDYKLEGYFCTKCGTLFEFDTKGNIISELENWG